MALRILFFSAWRFGQLGTPGTYKFIEELRRLYRIRVIARAPGPNSVYHDRGVPLLPMDGVPNTERIGRLAPAVRQFAPDVIYIFQSPEWPEVVARLKEAAPAARVILDIKSPYLQNDPAIRTAVQQRGDQAAGLLDQMVTRARENAASWFSSLPMEPHVYPLAVDVGAIPAQREDKRSAGWPRHWVFASSLHPKRKASLLLEGFALFLQRHPGAAVLHIFGDGPDRPLLEQQARDRGMDARVRFRGLIPQAELHHTLSTFDAGIAWVPRAVYDDSPSLKVLEYAAARLPILATATRAHKKMEEQGFYFEYCDDDPESLAQGMARLLERGDDPEALTCNAEAVRMCAYPCVVREHIVPVVESLTRREDGVASEIHEVRARDVPEGDEDIPSTLQRLLRLMFICETLSEGMGGTERIASELACEMAARGHVVYLAYVNRGEPAYSVPDTVVLVPFDCDADLHAIAAGADLDVLTVFYFNRESLVRYAAVAEAIGTPLVAQECTNPDQLRFHNWGHGQLSRVRAMWEREIATATASRLRLVMPSYKASFAEFQQPQIRAFANPCTPKALHARSDESTDGRWRILVVNGFKANKNLPDAVAAFAKLAVSYPDWQLRIVGKAPTWEDAHQKEVACLLDDYGLWKRVEIAGSTDDIETEFGSAHIHLIASLSEGCPTAVLEAMAAGVPSIGFEDCPGTNELIRHEANGLLARADDRVAGLVRALERLMSDPAWRRDLGARARRDAADFDPRHVYDQWECLLTEAADYREDPDRLFREQYAIDPERALHARRMRHKILEP